MKCLQIFLVVSLFFLRSGLGQSPFPQFWSLNQSRNNYILDLAAPASNASFGYSLRKLRKVYSGFSLRVRRSTDNAEADIRFDNNSIVGTGSVVTVAVAGSSGLTIGTTMALSTFKGVQQLFATIWYDQGPNGYNATQNTVSLQPELLMNTSGSDSTKPSLVFDGSGYLIVGQPIQNLVTSGITGSFLLAINPTSGSGVTQFSFGYINGGWRWSLNINYTTVCYFDAAEVCCAVVRSFPNSARVNKWKQYSFVRGTGDKKMRVSGDSVRYGTASSTAMTGGGFYIGSTFNKPAGNTDFEGGISEAILFPKDLSVVQLTPLELNQINYWKLL